MTGFRTNLPTDLGSILLPCSGSVLVHGVDPDFLIAPLPPVDAGDAGITQELHSGRVVEYYH